MRNQSANIFKLITLVGDAVLLFVVFLSVAWWRFDDLRISNPQYYNYYVQLLAITAVSWVSTASWAGAYTYRLGMEQRYITGNIVKAALVQLALLAVVLVALKGYYYSRLFMSVFFPVFYFTVSSLRWFAVRYLRAQLARGRWERRYLLLGTHPTAATFQELTAVRPELGWRLLGRYDDFAPDDRALEADEVVCAFDPSSNAYSRWQQWADHHGKRFRYLPNMGAHYAGQMSMETLEGIPIFAQRAEPLNALPNAMIKRTMDLVIALLLVAFLLSWWFLLTVVLLRLSGVRSPIFKQTRSGMGTKAFTVLKFRTMDQGGASNALQRWMRKTGADELLQLINVLKGEMSLVGPRPHTAEDDVDYSKFVMNYRVRHWAKPGMTGLAQVRGLRGSSQNAEALQERIRADVYYIEHWSVLLDLRILVETALRTLFAPSTLHSHSTVRNKE